MNCNVFPCVPAEPSIMAIDLLRQRWSGGDPSDCCETLHQHPVVQGWRRQAVAD
ncbi:hypothetical protein BRADI_4g07451v3 [Brachypodium distachyon]|uniref:Uncharacterized protein n=1 Tax=Brachypodium distachyon TaxID=15368 RepID=A0A0Q3EG96_BRADI|nr:hypothetical protein BRADI_4g07451v3 [Brachypodium distachyon]